jgi:hypothetical protein
LAARPDDWHSVRDRFARLGAEAAILAERRGQDRARYIAIDAAPKWARLPNRQAQAAAVLRQCRTSETR